MHTVLQQPHPTGGQEVTPQQLSHRLEFTLGSVHLQMDRREKTLERWRMNGRMDGDGGMQSEGGREGGMQRGLTGPPRSKSASALLPPLTGEVAPGLRIGGRRW